MDSAEFNFDVRPTRDRPQRNTIQIDENEDTMQAD